MVTKNEIEKFLTDGKKFMQENKDYTLYKYNIDDTYVFAIYWSEGFDPEDDQVIHSDEYSEYGLVVALKERNDSEWDGNYLDFPVDDEGNLIAEETLIGEDDDLSELAGYLYDDYRRVVLDEEE